MNTSTGQTNYYNLLSVDGSYNPLTATTFTVTTIRDGAIYTGMTVNVNLVDYQLGVYTAQWSASTTGNYQMFFQSSANNQIIASDVVHVLPDYAFTNTFYLGI
jgi:hypothetical protein